MALQYALAIYNFEATKEDEVSFSKGEKLCLVEGVRSDKNWWKVRNESNATGFAPANYMEVLPVEELEPKKRGGFMARTLRKMKKPGSSNRLSVALSGSADGVGAAGPGSNPTSPTASPVQSPRASTAALPSAPSAPAMPTAAPSGGRGTVRGSSRPASRVVPETAAPARYQYDKQGVGLAQCLTAFAASANDEMSLQINDVVVITDRCDDGWCFGEVAGSFGWFPHGAVQEFSDGSEGLATVCRATCLYDFDTTNYEELPFCANDVVEVLQKAEANWWLARHSDGRVGRIATNYIDAGEFTATTTTAARAAPAPAPAAAAPTAAAPAAVAPAAPVPTPALVPTPAHAGAGAGGGGGGVEPRPPWLHGAIKRKVCEQQLHEAGDFSFMIRESESRAGEFSISVKFGPKIHHFRINNIAGGKFAVSSNEFNNLTELVAHYREKPLQQINGTLLTLRTAVPNEEAAADDGGEEYTDVW